MKTARLRSLVLYIILIGFVVGVVFFIACYLLQGGAWALRPSNGHLQGQSQLSNAGSITDRNGTIIAQSIDGERVYHNDVTTRKALLHVLGDTNGYISTGVQTASLSALTGFNPVLGILQTEQGGEDLQLTVDSTLSAEALTLLGDRKGAVAMYNYKTGEVLCFVSTPTFDPENVPEDVTTNPAYEGVFLNKALSSSLPPGSTFKVVTAGAALENLPGVETRNFHCDGEVVIDGNTIVCDNHTAHGDQTLSQALTNSCNVAFAELAVELGKSKMTQTANEMGFNQSFPVDGNYTVKSSYDVSKADDAALAWSGIGQYTDLANPTNMMILMGAIANGGVSVLPHTIATTTPQDGARMLPTDVANQLKTMMRDNVINGYGDGMFPGLEVAAKTGTAEVEGQDSTGWIVGFSTQESTPFAFAVVVEQGGYGRTSAGQIASALMQTAARLDA